ncbi:hypothetical protein BO71DRAFT_279064, partial [Aspergillus ellipticus CBS 707.79]
CDALSPKGTECTNTTSKPDYFLCQPHHRECGELHHQYKQIEKKYRNLKLPRDFSVETARQKIAYGRQAVALRDQVRRRFFSESTKNKGHIQWILQLDAEIRALEEKVRVMEGGISSSSAAAVMPDTEEDDEEEDAEPQQKVPAHRSLFSSLSEKAFDHLPKNHPVTAVKRGLIKITDALIEKLYQAVPSLNDSLPTVEGIGGTRRAPNEGDHVMRFVFREYLSWSADAEALSRATQSDSIDSFLRGCDIAELEEYIDFFDSFTLHFLHDAVCDFFLPSDAPSATILGSAIATDDAHRKLDVRGWDILYGYFSSAHWWNVKSLCVSFEEVVLVQKLIALKRYGSSDGNPEWWSVGGLCYESVFHGFVPVTRGYLDSSKPAETETHGIVTQNEARCYLVGRMAKSEPLAERLIQELVKRVGRYIVVASDMKEGEIARTDEIEENPWVQRMRSAPVGHRLQDAVGAVDYSLQDICRKVQFMHFFQESNLGDDFIDIIIIDRQPGREFDILSEVTDALAMLAGDPSPQELLHRTIRTILPPNERAQYIKSHDLPNPPTISTLPLPDIHYEDNRIRSWSLADETTDLIIHQLHRKKSVRERRLIRKILTDMEYRGLITPLTRNQSVHTSPILLKGTDGHEDLYFNYNQNHNPSTHYPINRPGISTSADTLSTFAHSIQASYPTAVFAKGRLNVHYCAWPMPMPTITRSHPTFCTAEGYLYRWNVLPFDFPLSALSWQFYVRSKLNAKLPFVYIVGTTFVISAKTPALVETNIQQLLDVAGQHGWKVSVPEPFQWTRDIESLDLGTLWMGVGPA